MHLRVLATFAAGLLVVVDGSEVLDELLGLELVVGGSRRPASPQRGRHDTVALCRLQPPIIPLQRAV